jgi:hypothetical protein
VYVTWEAVNFVFSDNRLPRFDETKMGLNPGWGNRIAGHEKAMIRDRIAPLI